MPITTPLVVSDGSMFPYSRGILAQSILATGLSLDDAYYIAEKVLSKLHRSRKTHVTKAELKALVEKQLREDFDVQAAERYLALCAQPASIMVEHERTDVPFSKGILAQSLEASGIDPGIVQDLVLTIERDLLLSKRSRISRRELREITAAWLGKLYGEGYVERYMLWRNLMKPEKPLLILIGGATGTGKSTMAVELAHRLGISRVISSDAIRQIMRTMLSRELMPSIHSSSYDAWKIMNMVMEQGADPVIDAYREQVRRVSVGIQAILDRAIEENVSLIIDGVHILPGTIEKKYFKNALVATIIIFTADAEMHKERFVRRSSQASKRQTEKYLGNFGNIRLIQDYICDMAQRHHVPTFNNTDLDKTVTAIVSYLTEFIKAKLAKRSKARSEETART